MIVITVSLANEVVDIVEGSSGLFCAVIEDPTVQLDRQVLVEFFNRDITAKGMHVLHLGNFVLISSMDYELMLF